MSEDKLSFVVPYRDRDVSRIENLLNSIRMTTNFPFEFIVSDYGSQPAYAQRLLQSAEKSGYRVARSEAQGLPWNRAQAINNGVRSSQAPLIVVVDADMEFADRSIEYLVSRIQKDEVWFFESLWPQSPRQDPRRGLVGRSPGAFMMLGREWFERLQGMCEDFEFWGAEDTEWLGRLEGAGCRVQWLSHHDFLLFHTWHESDNSTVRRPFTAVSEAVEIECRTVWKGYQKKDWGRCLTLAERPVLPAMRREDVVVLDTQVSEQAVWLRLLKEHLDQGLCVRLELGPRVIPRALTRFAGLWKSVENFANRFSLKFEVTVNGRLETVLSLRKVIGPEALDVFIAPDYSFVYLVLKK
ncbi:MAG: glycosyltransferase [Spirochaetales bacterium]|nr:glycosyltransferase [Spirochaetales bacterium]